MDQPVISIVVAIYNVEKYLSACIESIINQKFHNIEIILVNDGSNDLGLEICLNYQRLDHRIIVINKENGGLTSARFAGWKQAKGKYIIFIDGDDTMHQNQLYEMHLSASNNNSDLVLCAYYIKTEKGIFESFINIPSLLNSKDNISKKYVCKLFEYESNSNIPSFMWMRLFKKSKITESCFISEKEVFMEDKIFNLMYATNIKVISYVNQPLYYYTIRKNSLSNSYRTNMWNMLSNAISASEKQLTLMGIRDPKFVLNSFIKHTIHITITNACKNSSFKNFQRDIKEMIRSNIYQCYFKSNRLSLNFSSFLIYSILLKLNAWHFIYFVNKLK